MTDEGTEPSRYNQRKYLYDRRARNALEKLINAGVAGDVLLELLDTARPYSPSRLKELRYRRKQLDDLASALEAAGKQAEQIVNDPLSVDWGALMLFGAKRFPVIPSEIETMRDCAKYVRQNAGALGELLRHTLRNAYRWHIGSLIGYVEQTTGKPHYSEVAILLTKAYDAFGRTEQFSADSIKKARQYCTKTIKSAR